MGQRRFHLFQCPATTYNNFTSINQCHLHAGNVTFALLNEYVLLLTGQRLPRPIREYVCIHDSQAIHQPDIDQTTMEKPQHCGQCLLHAVFGRLKFHELLVPLFDCRETVCILTVPPNANCGSTFGLVVYGQSRVVRKFQFHPCVSFYRGLTIRGGWSRRDRCATAQLEYQW